VNTGTLNKTTTDSFTISVPMQQQNATVNVQAGTLTLSAGSNTHQNVSWSVASGATLVLDGTHTFSGTQWLERGKRSDAGLGRHAHL
jgi:urocanate hydratase